MSLETATYVSDLVSTNPITNDDVGQGDDHIRLMKAVLKATFPNSTKPFYFPTTLSKSANYSVLSTDGGATIFVTTTGGSVVLTLPSLVVGDAGWEISVIKVTTDVNPLFIEPPSGTIQSGEISGLARTRRCIPGRRTRVMWTGTSFIADRVLSMPIGSVIDYNLASLPVGFEWPNGQTFASASTVYPDYFSANGDSGATLDLRGRVAAGKDDMGGSSADRLTGQSGGVNGDTLAATGGDETHSLTQAQLPAITPAGSVSLTTPRVYIRNNIAGSGTSDNMVKAGSAGSDGDEVFTYHTAPTASFTGTPFGSDGAHNNVQPTIVLNKLLVVE